MHAFRYPSLAILSLAMFFLISCATRSGQPNTSPAGIWENGVLVVNHTDNNRTTELHVGERLEIHLPENPTTGFKWAIDENDRRILALDDTVYIPPLEGGFIGARGQRTFTFTARQPGEVALKLKYWRVWEGDSSVVERFGVTVRVIVAAKN